MAALGLTLLPLSAAATPSTSSGTTSPQAVPGQAAAPHAAALGDTGRTRVTLPTGQRIWVSGSPGRETVVHEPSTGRESTAPLVTRQRGTRTYVVPVVAEPYLDRQLDPELFNVTRLAADRRAGRVESLEVTHSGGTARLPGITLTASGRGRASARLSSDSATAFGRALTAQWQRDRSAGGRIDDAFFGNVTRVAPAGAAAAPEAPRAAAAATYELVIRGIGAEGQPLTNEYLHIVNMDDSSKYDEYLMITGGDLRVSVPKGTYSVFGSQYTYQPGASIEYTARVLWANDVAVTTDGGSVVLDVRDATVDATPVVPRPAEQSWYAVTFDWVDAKGASATRIADSTTSDVPTRYLYSPAAAATVGTLKVSQQWMLQESAPRPSYAYWVSAYSKSIPTKPNYTFTEDRLATVSATYHGDGSGRRGAILRSPQLSTVDSPASGIGGVLEWVDPGTRRTEYLGSTTTKAPLWETSAQQTVGAVDDGWLDQQLKAYPRGSTTKEAWFKGPWASGILTQSADQRPFCYACREDDLLHFRIRGYTDSNRAHAGYFLRSQDEDPVARVRLYRGKTLLVDSPDWLYVWDYVPKKRNTYHVLVDFDRRQGEPLLSTKSSTKYTFRSARDEGRKIGKGWTCDMDGGTGDPCRVLPVLQGTLGLPTAIADGSLPAGKSTVTVTLKRIQQAAATTVKTATLEVRPVGATAWTKVKLTSVGSGKYEGTVNNAAWSGKLVHVRYGGTDKDGSAFLQTVHRAYRVR